MGSFARYRRQNRHAAQSWARAHRRKPQRFEWLWRWLSTARTASVVRSRAHPHRRKSQRVEWLRWSLSTTRTASVVRSQAYPLR
ncbi:hypothetical protein EMIT0111MI5_130191 [Burkholderia sp. IT-111MI5]